MSAWDKDNTIGQRCIRELALKYIVKTVEKKLHIE